jgi:Flp pilus assembly protein TadG
MPVRSPVSNDTRVLSPRRQRRGSASLEFALIAVPFFLLLFGITDMARYLLFSHGVNVITSEATRYMMVQIMAGSSFTNGCQTSSSVAAQVASAAPYLDQTRLTFCTTTSTITPAGGTPATEVMVTASYPFSFMFPAAWGGNQTLSGKAGVEF